MRTDPPSVTRAVALERLGSLAGLPLPELRRIARIAAQVARQSYGNPMAAVHLHDDTFQHRVAGAGVPLARTPVDDSMCIQVVDGERTIYCADATREPRFGDNPYTRGSDPVRLYYATPLRLGDGTTIGALCVFDHHAGTLDDAQRARLVDLAQQTTVYLELSAANRDLAYRAGHDELTGLANRFTLSDRLGAALADGRRADHEPALLLVDLDDFKLVNDRHGHVVGDEVLAGTAARLTAAVRADDVVARIGGDEFAVLFEHVPDQARLREIAARVAARTAVPYDTSAGPVVCRASVGLTFGQPGDLPYELLGRADAAMYDDKNTCRPTLPEPRTRREQVAAR